MRTTRKRQGARRRPRRNAPNRPETVTRSLDFTCFNNTRRVVVASSVELDTANPVKVVGFGARTTPGSELGACQAFLAQFNEYANVRVLGFRIHFDQRGSPAKLARCGAYILPGPPSDYDPAKVGTLTAWLGHSLVQTSPGRPLCLRVGPQFSAGRFGEIDSATTTSLVLASIDYQGTVRIVTTYEVAGPPLDPKVSP